MVEQYQTTCPKEWDSSSEYFIRLPFKMFQLQIEASIGFKIRTKDIGVSRLQGGIFGR